MAKINDIAQMLGLSVSTVYKAFNGANDIKPETRTYILEAAAEIGYTPKTKGKGRRIVVFAGYLEADFITHYLYQIMISFKQIAMQGGFEILILPVDRTDIKYFSALMQELRAEACMILVLNDEDFQQLRGFGYPTVLVDNYVDQKNIACATSDKLIGVELQIRHLAELGHRRIGFINSSQGAGRKERLAGYVNTLAGLNIPYEQALVKNGDFSEQSGGILAEELLAQGVSAIACANDLMAIGAMRRLVSLNVRIPDDISVIGFDDIKLASYVVPALTSVHISTQNMGMQAFICLKNLLENNISTRVVESPSLIVRNSTARARHIV